MCRLLVGQTNDIGNAEFAKIIQLQYGELESMDDGIGAFIIDAKGKIHIKRELTDYAKVFSFVNDLLPTAKLVALHSRFSTSGTVSPGNVHFFEQDGLVLAHNGFVGGFIGSQCMGCTTSNKGVCKRHRKHPASATAASLTEVADCDTRQFLDYLATNYSAVTKKTLEANIDMHSFSGVGFLYDRKKEQAFLFSRRREKDPIKVLTDNQQFAVFFSYPPITDVSYEQEVYNEIMGVPVLVDNDDLEIKTDLEVKEAPAGVFKLTDTVSQTAIDFVPVPPAKDDDELVTQPYASHYGSAWADEPSDAPRLNWGTKEVVTPPAPVEKKEHQPLVVLNDDEYARFVPVDDIGFTGHCDMCQDVKANNLLRRDQESDSTLCVDCIRQLAHSYA